MLPDGVRICESAVPPWWVKGNHRIHCNIPKEELETLELVVYETTG